MIIKYNNKFYNQCIKLLANELADAKMVPYCSITLESLHQYIVGYDMFYNDEFISFINIENNVVRGLVNVKRLSKKKSKIKIKVIPMLFRYGFRKLYKLNQMNKHIEQHSCNEGELYISNVVVGSKYQGLGIGRELFNRVEQYSKQENYSCITLAVASSNTRAKKLYEKLGFNTIQRHNLPKKMSKSINIDYFDSMKKVVK